MTALDLAISQDLDRGPPPTPLKSGSLQDNSQMDAATNPSPTMDAASDLHPSTNTSDYDPARPMPELILDLNLIPLEKIPISYSAKLQSKSTSFVLADKTDETLPLTSIREGVTLAWKVPAQSTIKQETVAISIAKSYHPFFINSLTPGFVFSSFREEDREQYEYALTHAIKINNDFFVPSRTRYGVSGQQIITALHVPPYVAKNPVNKQAFTDFLQRTFGNYGSVHGVTLTYFGTKTFLGTATFSLDLSAFSASGSSFPRIAGFGQGNILFKWVNAPIICYRCGSQDHLMKDCHLGHGPAIHDRPPVPSPILCRRRAEPLSNPSPPPNPSPAQSHNPYPASFPSARPPATLTPTSLALPVDLEWSQTQKKYSMMQPKSSIGDISTGGPSPTSGSTQTSAFSEEAVKKKTKRGGRKVKEQREKRAVQAAAKGKERVSDSSPVVLSRHPLPQKPPQTSLSQTPFVFSRTAQIQLAPEDKEGFSAKDSDEKKRTHSQHTSPDGGKKAKVGNIPAIASPLSTKAAPSTEAADAASSSSPKIPSVDAPKSGAEPEEIKDPSKASNGDTEKNPLDLVDYDEDQDKIALTPEDLAALKTNPNPNAMDES